MTTVSSASGGARMSRHENARRPWREALPQRVRWSRTVTAAGLTPRAVACRRISASMAVRARGRSHASRTAASGPPVGRGEPHDQLVLVGAPDALDRGAASTGRRGHDPQPMELAAEPDGRPVPQAAARDEDRAVAGHPLEVAPQPRLALGEERA